MLLSIRSRDLVPLLVLFVLIIDSHCSLSKSSRKSDKTKKSVTKVEDKKPEAVQPAKILQSDSQETPQEILASHAMYNKSTQDTKLFPNTVLGYVTPWNSHGYDVAKWFSAKLDLVSPVWLQIRRRGGKGEFYMTGDHDVDQGWVRDVRSKGSKIVPRVIFDGWTVDDYKAILWNEYVASGCARTISEFIKTHGFDGVTIEVWSQLGGQVRKELAHFLSHLAEELHSSELLFILVIPPASYDGDRPGMFDEHDFSQLEPHVDFFSLMTYDYSNAMKPGPNSPLDWVEHCVRLLVPDDLSIARQKILLGLNFYGNDYSKDDGQPIIGSQLVQLIEKHRPTLHWKEKSAEHVFKYKHANKVHEVYYPTRESIHIRVELAKQLGVGISIWEMGQGLDYFYDLL